MDADRSRCWNLRPSCAATAKMGFFRIFDPMLYAPTIDGHGTEKHHVLCPSLPRFARNDPRREEGGFDLT